MDFKTINIKGKEYVTVNERLKHFRSAFPDFSLETELIEVNDKTALIRAVIRNPQGRIVATGTAYERADNKKSLVNSTSHVENGETSAWGRALGNLGIGIDTSVASAEEVVRAETKPAYESKPTSNTVVVSKGARTTAVKPPPSQTIIMESLTGCKSPSQVDIVWRSAMKYDWTPPQLQDLETCKTNVLAKIETQRSDDAKAIIDSIV